MSEGRIVVVGGGHAAAQLCSQLVDAGAGSRVCLLSEEAAYPYHRPPLSKTFLKSEAEAHQLHRDEAWYAQHGIDVRLGVAVQEVDRAGRAIRLASGERVSYDWLVLATGTRARMLPQLAAPLRNVAVLRDVGHARQLRERLLAAQSGALTVVGGGFIGLEVAATARHLGWSVTVLEAAARLLARSASPELAAHILQHHREAGIDVRLGVRIGDARVEGERVAALEIDGVPERVEHVLVGVGAVPQTTLAQDAGLTIGNGILVDERMVTSDPHILAIGDCSCFEYQGRRVRLESVQNANDQAKVAAATVLGRVAAYDPLPFFWSDQGALKLQMAGLWREGLEAHRRPGPTAQGFSLFHYDGGRLACVESANAPVDHMMARRLLEQRVSPAPGRVVDATQPLKTLFA